MFHQTYAPSFRNRTLLDKIVSTGLEKNQKIHFLSKFTPGPCCWGKDAGNFPEKCPVQIWKRYIPLLIDLLISNNFSSMTFFVQHVFYELSVVKVYDSQPIFLLMFWHNKKKQVGKIKFIK